MSKAKDDRSGFLAGNSSGIISFYYWLCFFKCHLSHEILSSVPVLPGATLCGMTQHYQPFKYGMGASPSFVTMILPCSAGE